MADVHHHLKQHLHHKKHARANLQSMSERKTASTFVGNFRAISETLLAPFYFVLRVLYVFIQDLIIVLFKPNPPPAKIEHPYARIAIIGAGLTGVSSAAHAIAHGFEVVLYEATDRPGGIWAHENKTSGLQINSLLYRFHPAVLWKEAFPKRDEILGEIDKIWKEYRLEERTRLNTRVTKVKRVKRQGYDEYSQAHVASPSIWYINDGEDGPFDALIVTVGTCGEPKWVKFKGMPENAGKLDKLGAASRSNEPGLITPGAGGVPDDPATVDRGEEEKPRQQRKKAHQVQAQKSSGRHEVVDPAMPSQDEVHTKTSGSPPAPEQHDPDTYRGPVIHSSQLDFATPELLRGKTVVVIGSGASAVEAVETALSRDAHRCIVLAREDKWIIPRNVIFDTFLAAQPFGREMPLSFLWERFLSLWQYHGVEDLVPTAPIFGGTPIVNDEFLNHVRSGKCVYVRGDTLRLTQNGVLVNVRERIERGAPLGFGGGVREKNLKDINVDIGDTDASGHDIHKAKRQARKMKQKRKSQDEPRVEEIDADLVVLATGYERPTIDFLPDDLFPEGYERPNLYLQNFCTEDWSVLMTNSSYQNAIGTVGHFHIGIYTRILLTLLLDSTTRPTTRDMKLWVDVIRYIKRGASGGALGFFTYMELTIWLILFHIFRPDRLRWISFIMPGWGVHPDDEWLELMNH